MRAIGGRLLSAVLFCDRLVVSTGAAYDDACRTVEQAGGRVVDSNGLGVVAGFEVPSDAVAGGLRLVQLDATFRVGVAFGEVSVDQADWFGLTVVEAARLHHLAVPGQVLVSSRVAEAVDGSGLQAFGEHTLKGMPETDVVHVAVDEPIGGPRNVEVFLAIDMVGSTVLLARAGDAAMVLVQRRLEEIVHKTAAEWGGVVPRSTGRWAARWGLLR